MKLGISILLMFIVFSCSETSSDPGELREEKFCKDITWNNLLTDDQIDLPCENWKSINEPCLSDKYLEDFDAVIRFTIESSRNYSTVYRINNLDGCLILTRKVIPLGYFGVFNFFRNANNRIVQYEYLTKIVDLTSYQKVLDLISEIKDFPMQEENIETLDGESFYVESYTEKSLSVRAFSEKNENLLRMEELLKEMCEI